MTNRRHSALGWAEPGAIDLASWIAIGLFPPTEPTRVVVTQPDGRLRLIKTWPTEDGAISHLRLLRQRAELIDRQMAPPPGEKDWRG